MLVNQNRIYDILTIEHATIIAAMINSDGGSILFRGKDFDSIYRNLQKLASDKIRPNPLANITSSIRFRDEGAILEVRISPDNSQLYEVDTKRGFKVYVIENLELKELTNKQKEDLLARRYGGDDPLRNKAGILTSPTFRYFKLFLTPEFLAFNEQEFASFFKLLTPNGDFNVNADLLADQNPYPFFFYRYKGNSFGGDMVRTNYGNRPLPMTYQALKMRLEAELIAMSDFSNRPFNLDSIEMLINNLFISNDYLINSPSIAFFDNRVEFTYYLRDSSTMKMNLNPQSFKNTSLENVLTTYGLINTPLYLDESILLGLNISVKKEQNKVITILHFDNDLSKIKEERIRRLAMPFKESEGKVYNMLKNDPTLRAEDIAYLLSRSKKTVERAFITLQNKGYIRRVGSKRYGHWEVYKKPSDNFI